MEKDPKDYEIGFLAEDEAGVQKVLQILSAHRAEVLLEGPVERIALAYPIEHRTAAHFGYVHFRIVPEGAELLKQAFKTPGILRFLIVTPPFAKPKPRWEGRPRRGATTATTPAVASPEAPTSLPLSNEALEKKIEEILK